MALFAPCIHIFLIIMVLQWSFCIKQHELLALPKPRGLSYPAPLSHRDLHLVTSQHVTLVLAGAKQRAGIQDLFFPLHQPLAPYDFLTPHFSAG